MGLSGQYADLLMCVYGDRTYPLRAHLQAPFRAGARAITPAMELYNKNMSKVRTSVEWIFGDVINSFKSLDYKILFSCVALAYLITFIQKEYFV